MPQSSFAYSFNEYSVQCCESKESLSAVVALINRARAWRLDNAKPLIRAMKADPEFNDLSAGAMRTNLILMLDAAVNPRRYPDKILLWDSKPALGFSIAYVLGGFAISWPCCCSLAVGGDVALMDERGEVVQGSVRHIGCEDHLFEHWGSCVAAARRVVRVSKNIKRVDGGMKNGVGEVPHVHFQNGEALNVDGTWKHGAGSRITKEDKRHLLGAGWILPIED